MSKFDILTVLIIFIFVLLFLFSFLLPDLLKIYPDLLKK